MSETNGAVADITALGDKIAALTLTQAVQLKDYLKEKYKIEPAAGGAVMVARAVAARPRLRSRPKRPNSRRLSKAVTRPTRRSPSSR